MIYLVMIDCDDKYDGDYDFKSESLLMSKKKNGENCNVDW